MTDRKDWWIPDEWYIYHRLRKVLKYDRFKVMICVECGTGFEWAYDQTLGMSIHYYKDFPSISCEKDICPRCK